MQNLGAANLNAPLPAQAQPKSEVDILEITKETLVESASEFEDGPRVEGGSRARGKHFAVAVWKFAYRSAASASPGASERWEHITESIHDFRIVAHQLR
jgi:hypothetical protein